MSHPPVAYPTPPTTARAPDVRSGMPHAVLRERLIRRLSQACDVPVALLVAPAGYGKTTLLSQWTRHDVRPFAVIAVREADNDPRHLLESVARALSGVAPIDDDVFIALLTPGGSVVPDVLDRLERSLVGSGPFVLALDDVGVLESAGSRAVLTALAERVPA